MTSIVLKHTRENLEDLGKFFRDILNLCINEGQTLLGTALIDEFEEQLPKHDMEDYLEKFIERCYNKKLNRFLSWDKIKKRDETHFKENLTSMLDEEYQDAFQPYIDLLDLKDQEITF